MTKLLAITYCSYAEAMFSKLIHTPHGFSLDHISQIKKKSKRSVFDGWTKCIELAVKKIKGQKSNHVPNVKQKLNEIIRDYILDPSHIRNKIAHGQWVVALNGPNTAIQDDLTIKLREIDVVILSRHQKALVILCKITEDLIISPQKAHSRDYWEYLTDLSDSLHAMEAWSLEAKIEKLKRKNNYQRR